MENKLFEESIILIGPSGAGKSTIAEILKNITGEPNTKVYGSLAFLTRRIIMFENLKKFLKLLLHKAKVGNGQNITYTKNLKLSVVNLKKKVLNQKLQCGQSEAL